MIVSIPTAFSSMMVWALVFAADMAAEFTDVPKSLRRKEMVGEFRGLGCEKDYVYRWRKLAMLTADTSSLFVIVTKEDDAIRVFWRMCVSKSRHKHPLSSGAVVCRHEFAAIERKTHQKATIIH